MDCVKLYYKEELVGILTYKEPQYIFVKNDKFSNPELVKHIGLKDKNEYYSNRLFTFFLRFIPQKSNMISVWGHPPSVKVVDNSIINIP